MAFTSTAPFKFKSEIIYNRVGKPFKESNERRKSDGTSYQQSRVVKTHKYDEELRLARTSIGDEQGLSIKKFINVYDSIGRLVITISPSGRKTKLYYNERSLVAKEVNDYGGIASYH